MEGGEPTKNEGNINESKKTAETELYTVETKLYTVSVVVTTPLTQVFNVFSKKDTYLILKGNGIREEKYLGKLSGANPISVIFEDIPPGSYTLTLIWGDEVYNKSITVSGDLQIKFMITI